MVNYEEKKVEELKRMMRGIGMTSNQWPARKKDMVLRLQEWDAAHPDDVAVNKELGAGGLARSQVSTRAPVQAPVPAPEQPEGSRKRKESTPLADAGARPKRQKKNEREDGPSDVENASSTVKPTLISKLPLPKSSSRLGLSPTREEGGDEDEEVAPSKTSTRDPQTQVAIATKADKKSAVSKAVKPSIKRQVKKFSSAQPVAVSSGQTRSAVQSQISGSKPAALKSSQAQPVTRKNRANKMSKDNSKDEQDRPSSNEPDGFELERPIPRKTTRSLEGKGTAVSQNLTSSEEDEVEITTSEDSGGDGEQEDASAPEAKGMEEAAGKDDKTPPRGRARWRTVKLKMDNDVSPGTERAPLEQLGTWRREERLLEIERAAGREPKLWMGGDRDEDDRERSPMEMAFPPKSPT